MARWHRTGAETATGSTTLDCKTSTIAAREPPIRSTIVSAVLLLGGMLFSAAAAADLNYVVVGVEDPLRANVLSHVDPVQLGSRIRLAPRDLEKVRMDAVRDARAALRPFGYYAPVIDARVMPGESGSGIVEITIDPGPPIRVAAADIRLAGPGVDDAVFRDWHRRWPLAAGSRLDQTVWAQYKQEALDIGYQRGFLDATFTEHRLALDLEQNTAAVTLVLDTGRRYVFGDVAFGDHVLRPGILEYVPRFEKGDSFTAEALGLFRTDLWKTTYFTDVQVVEVRRPDLDPPAVDLDVRLETATRNRYQGALGYGTDTGIRLQTGWTRTPMSRRGDRIDLGVGWQQLDQEVRVRGNYLMPRRERGRQWWETELTFRFEDLDLEVKRNEEDENSILLAKGDIRESHLRFARLKLHNLQNGGESQLFERLFVQYLNSERRFGIDSGQPGLVLPVDDPEFQRRTLTTDNAFSVGADLDLIDVNGRGFDTTGRRDRAWIFFSDKAFGSEVEFIQAYAATRRSYRLREQWKLHLRAEIGYTDADVDNFTIDVGGEPLDLSLTTLPNFYRFKAGGSSSVRGYGFQQLSDNDLGSNNLVTASAEVEYRVLDNWSVATFFDIGNAFNDWDEVNLKRGVGIGIRWYSIAGEVRLDVASALDFTDDPWRVHLTIGTPLL